MNKRNELDNFTTVFTNADLADTPEGSMEECQNLRRLPGKLVKTYGAGYLQDGDSVVPSENNVCPITVASGYSVINIFCYINENLTDGREYIALIQNDSTQQVWIVKFDSTFNASASTPSILLPIDVDSFWIKGDTSPAQTFNAYGSIMPTSVVATDANAKTYPFPSTAKFHAPSEVDYVDDSATVAFGDMPSDLGRATFATGDDQYTGFNDTVAFENDAIETFDNASGEKGVVRMARASDVVFLVTTAKFGPNLPDLLLYHNGIAWTEIPSTDFGVTVDTGDSLYILNITEMGDDLYLIYLHKDVSDVGNEFKYGFCRYYDIGGTQTWDNGIWTQSESADFLAGNTSLPHDDVTAVKQNFGDDHLFFYLNGLSVSTVCPGYLLEYSVAGDKNLLSGPTFANSDARSTVGIAFAAEKLKLLVNNTATPEVEIYSATSPVTPSWGTKDTLPSSITGLTDTVTSWLSSDFIVSKPDSKGGNGTSFGFIVELDLTATADSHVFVEYDGTLDKYSGDDSYVFASATYSIRSLVYTNHIDRTGGKYLSNVYATASEVWQTGEDLVSSLMRTGRASHYIQAMLSYEVTLDHVTSIHYLFGDMDPLLTTDPVLNRVVSFGANPVYSSYPSGFVYEASFSACTGWIELFQSLDMDMEFDLYHKADRNPIIMDSGAIRFLPGAVGEVSGNEAKGLWLGYIDRNFYDGLYSAGSEYTAGFRAYDKTPLTPYPYVNTSPIFGDVSMIGLGGTTNDAWIRYSFIYDGIEESLLSNAYQISYGAGTYDNKASVTMKLYDSVISAIRSNSRITGIRFYSMDTGQSAAPGALVGSISFTRDLSKQETYSANGYCGTQTAWITNPTNITSWYVGRYLESTAGGTYHLITACVDVDGAGGEGFVLTVATGLGTVTKFDGSWAIYDDAVGTSEDENGATGGYFGAKVLIDTSRDLETYGLLGLTISSVTSTAAVSGIFTGAIVEDTAQHALQMSEQGVGEEQFSYILSGVPYLFKLYSGVYYLKAVLDLSLTAPAYSLEGSPSIKVNPDFAKIMVGRLFTLSNILDPGGENEEQFAALGYSEYEQYDVLPVGNLIKFNDREGGGGTGLEEIYGRPVVAFKQGISIMRVSDPDPTNWTIAESPHNIGNIAKQGMVSAQGKVYVCYYDGIYALTANNLAETDMTPTDRLKVSFPIEDKYLALSQTQKEAIVGEYDQSKEEILWQLGDEQWAYSTDTGYWREVLQYITGTTKTTIDIITIDENADLMFYDETDDAIRSFTNPAAVPTLMRTKKYNIAIERDELLRYMWVFNPYSDAMTITPYMDGVALPTTVVSASTAKQKIVIKRRGLDFQVQVSWASSSNNNELKRLGLEYDN